MNIIARARNKTCTYLIPLSVIAIFIILIALFNQNTSGKPNSPELLPPTPYERLFSDDSLIVDRLDFPVGDPPLREYYNAQKFGIRNSNFNNAYHLGEDWNGTGGGDSDLGDPVYAIGNGVVLYAGDFGPGWGNVVTILHRLKSDHTIVSLYGHLHDFSVSEGEFVKYRKQIGSIGNADGIYYAHLHFEIRSDISLDIGGGYSKSTKGYIAPTPFISCYQSGCPKLINKDKMSVKNRFSTPAGYKRINYSKLSYARFMQNLPLKPFSHIVRYFNGDIKSPEGIYISVLDYETGPKDLLQCADAAMLLRAEYLFAQKQYSKIRFNFLSDGKPRYYSKFGGDQSDYKNFRKYMDYIFAYANTSSLHHELKPKKIELISPGDIFIQKGKPYGHAVIVVDCAESETGERLFMLAQSFMPAQEIQILVNPKEPYLSPWFSNRREKIETPEWLFSTTDLRSF
ncbi:MAG: DUF4846 domain-containing protein [Spirochaetes bacterium]|jgi:murein DD-endopeptidase MepM/ murein hydrolase activator NlpD|nr:DUF4846 domain-containing protein [Spirochaetota bacterium]